MGMFGHFGGALTTAMQAAGTSYQVNAASAKPEPRVGESMFDFEARQQAWESAEMQAGRIPMWVAGASLPPSPETIAMKKRTRWNGSTWVDPQSTGGPVVTKLGGMTGRTKVLLGAVGLGALYFLFKNR